MTDLTFDFLKDMPSDERFNLIDQMNRASCSIPSKIAEGSGKRTSNHFAEFLSTVLSSSFELETQYLICERRKYGNNNKLKYCLTIINEL